MGGPLTLVILVAAGQASDPSTGALTRAAHDALGPDTRVDVRETSSAPTDADALQAERGAEVDAVAEVIWNDAQQAALHVLVPRTGRWVYRTIGFDASDAPIERGRTLGFAVASMLPEGGLPEAGSAGSASSHPSPAGVEAASGPPLPLSAPAPDDKRPPSLAPAAAAPNVFVDVYGIGTVGVGGTAQGIGAAAAGRWFALPMLAFRVGGGALAGTVSEADATTLYLMGTAGIAFHPFRARPGRPVGAALRVEYVLERQSMSRVASSPTTPGSYERWLSGASAMLEGDVLFAPNVEVVLAVGAVDLFSPTYVDVQGAQVATLPAVRAQGELGFRIRF